MTLEAITYRSILVELVGGDVVHWEDDLDVVAFGLFEQSLDLLGTLFVEEGVANLRSGLVR